MNSSPQPDFGRAQMVAGVIGVTGIALSLIGLFTNPDQFFRSYLFAFVFWVGIPLGCLGVLMLHHMVGGNWGFVIRRLLEAGSKTVPLMLLLFLPLGIFGLKHLYPWTRQGTVADNPFQSVYLTTGFFWVRAFIFFLIWIAVPWILTRWSYEQDQTGDPSILNKLQYLSAPGILLYGATVTFASVDWVMSLEPHWFSTIYGMIFMVSQALGALAIIVVTERLLCEYEPLKSVLTPSHFHDHGSLLFAFTMLWAYLSFSQFLIIWSGNLQEEIPWYMTRTHGGWAFVALGLVVLHFAVPWVILLNRVIKRNIRILWGVALGLVVMSIADFYWLVVPAFPSEHAGPHVHPLDLTALLGIGGMWVATYIWRIKGHPLLPLRDARFEGGPSHGH